jgi:hypothetical protein
MNEPTHCILIINHDAGNSYSRTSFENAKKAMRSPSVVALNESTYIVAFPDAAKALLEVAAIEMRQKDQRTLHFCLIPCGSRVFGELAKEVAVALDGLGLSYSETPFPAPLPLH